MAEPAQPDAPHAPVPLRPAPQSPVLAPSLPHPLTALIGREREVETVQDLLLRDDVRLVTLTGPGGVGKSRVAIAAATALEHVFPDGVVFVSLAALRDPDAVLATLASALAVPERGERTTLATLQSALRSRQLLLLLDSFETVLAAAPALAELLEACPAVTALVTSRARLRLRGERVLPIAPLALPEREDAAPEQLLASPAVALFVERAHDLRPAFALMAENAAAVGEAVRRLEGLPLAIELAAARLELFGPAALLARLERRLPLLTGGAHDLPERQRTMQAAIAWSYDLLPVERQRTFRRLAVCRGSFSLATAAACAELEERMALEELAALAEQSLVRRVDGDDAAEAMPRFVMLDTIREFAEDQLVASGEEDQVRRRHAHAILELAENAAGTERGRHLTTAFVRLDAEHDRLLDAEQDQLREALRWAIANEPATGLRIAATLVRYLYFHWHVGESRSWFERVLAASPWPSVERAKVLYGAGFAASYQGDHDRAVACLEEALHLARAFAEPVVIADTLFALGTDGEDQGDYERGRAHLSEALNHFRQADDRTAVTLTQYHLGVVAYGRGDHDAARDMLEEACDLAAAQENDAIAIAPVWYLALIAIDAGDAATAARALLRCLASEHTLAQPEGISRVLSILAVLASACGEPLLAARLLGAAAAAADDIGYVAALPERARFERAQQAVSTALGAEAFAAALSAGRALSTPQAIEEATALAQGLIASAPRPSRTVTDPLPDFAPAFTLTTREVEVLRLLADGQTNPEIAQTLFISPGTVRIHVSHILAKLDTRTRTEAAATARRLGLL